MKHFLRLRVLLAGTLLMVVTVAVLVLSWSGGVYGVFSDTESTGASVAAGSLDSPGDLECKFLCFFWAELRWSPPVGTSPESYRIYHDEPFGDDEFEQLAQVTAPDTSYDQLRPAFFRHRYFVTSVLHNWESEPSSIIQVRCRPRDHFFPGPCWLKGKNHHSTRSVELTWGQTLRAVSYGVLRSTEAGGPYDVLAVTATPAYTDSAVLDGVTYYYVVVALDAAGNESDPSPEVVVPDVVATPSPTPTSTPAPTATATLTPQPSPTLTATPTPTTTATATPTATATASPSPEPEPTVTSTAEATATLGPEPTLTSTPLPTVTPAPEPSAAPSPTPEPTSTPEPTPTGTLEPTTTPTPKAEPGSEATPTASAEPS